jgi:hypothetical protein
MAHRRKDFYAIVYPSGSWFIEGDWFQAEKRIKGVAGVKHRGFWDRSEAVRWAKRESNAAKPPSFHRGSLPNLVRHEWREAQITDQFNIMKDAGLI